MRLILTDAPPDAIGQGVRHHIGPRGGVSILGVNRRSYVQMEDPVIRLRVRALIRRYGRP